MIHEILGVAAIGESFIGDIFGLIPKGDAIHQRCPICGVKTDRFATRTEFEIRVMTIWIIENICVGPYQKIAALPKKCPGVNLPLSWIQQIVGKIHAAQIAVPGPEL